MDCRPGLICKWLKTRNHKNTLNSLVHNKNVSYITSNMDSVSSPNIEAESCFKD